MQDELLQLAAEVRSLAELTSAAQLPGLLPDGVRDLLGRANRALEGNLPIPVRVRVEAIRDALGTLRTQLGIRLWDAQATPTYEQGCRRSAALIETLATNLEKTMAATEDRRQGHLLLPPMRPKEEAVLRVLAERPPHLPITSEQLAAEVARRNLPYTDAPGIRSRMIPKFKKLGLVSHGKRGYSFPSEASTRVRKALDPDADEMRTRGGS